MVRLFLLSFFALRFLSFPPEEKKRGGDPLDPVPDLNINPKAALAGATRELGRKVKKAALDEVCAVAKADRPVGKDVQKYGDVDHQIKKARVDGMHSQVTKNQIDAIVQQIKVMQENRKFLLSKCVWGQIVVGQVKYSLSQLRYTYLLRSSWCHLRRNITNSICS